MIKQVYEALKIESRKGDFVDLIKKDLEEVNIDIKEDDVKLMKKIDWKRYVHHIVKETAFEHLVNENKEKSKTKHINFEKLEMAKYLLVNKSTSLSKVIFSVRAGTYDIKAWNEWKYTDSMCVMCNMLEENMDHFMSCLAYGKSRNDINWKYIFENDLEKQHFIVLEIKRRDYIRKYKLDKAGLPSQNLAPMLHLPFEPKLLLTAYFLLLCGIK